MARATLAAVLAVSGRGVGRCEDNCDITCFPRYSHLCCRGGLRAEIQSTARAPANSPGVVPKCSRKLAMKADTES